MLSMFIDFLGLDPGVWIHGFGFLGLDSWFGIHGFGFMGLDSWVWIPGFGFLGLDSWVWIPGFGFLSLKSGLGFLGWDSWIWLRIRTLIKTLSKPMIWKQKLQIMTTHVQPSDARGHPAWKPVSFYKPFISWRAHCNSHYRGRVDWRRFLEIPLI